MEEVLNRGIKEVIDQYPEVGKILDTYRIGCVPCDVGTCLLKDVVAIHGLSPEDEQEMMSRIAKAIYPGQNMTIPVRQRNREARSEILKYTPPMRLLVDEHKLIKRWLALIPRVIEEVDLKSSEGRELILAGVDFIRSYADRFHHAKEEDILFKYFDENLEILQVMHRDHEKARSHVRALIEAVENRDKEAMAGHLLAYKELLTEHIRKEDEVLYPWMDRELSIVQLGELQARFEEVDQRFGEAAMRYEAFVEELEKG